MADFTVHHMMLYLPQTFEGNRPEEYWKTYHFTIAVKSGELGDRSKFKIKRGTFEINKSNAHLCREMFGKWMAELFAATAADPVTVIPVPSKDSIVGGAPEPRSLKMLKESCGCNPNIKVVDAVRFTRTLPKASTGGGRRDPQLLFDAMQVISTAPKKGRVYLVDDVYTSGSTIRAAKQRLTDAGFVVTAAVVCGLTVHGTEQRATEPGAITINDELSPTFDISKLLKDLIKR